MLMSSGWRCLSLLEKCKNLRQLKQGHAQLLSCGFGANPLALSRLLAFCSDPLRGSLSYASKLFDRIPEPTVCICNTILKTLISKHEFLKTLQIYARMLRTGPCPDHYTFPCVLKACAGLRSFSLGQLVHGNCLKLGLFFDAFVGDSVICMYTALGDMGAAGKVFDEMPSHTAAAWTVMISGYAKGGDVEKARLFFDRAPMVKDLGIWGSMVSGYVQNGCFKEGLHMFHLIQSAGLTPDEPIFVSVLCACAHLGALDTGVWIHRFVEQLRLPMSVKLGTGLIDMYAKCGNLEIAKRVFDGMPRRDTICWNAMISGMATHGDGEGALKLFRQMENIGVMPDDLTFLALFTACSYSGMAVEGLEMLDTMCTVYGIEPKSEHYGCLVDILAAAGQLEEAEQIITRMPNSNASEEAVAWRAFLSACCHHREAQVAEVAAEKLLHLERHSGVYVLLSNLYSASGKHDSAGRIRRMMRSGGVEKIPGCSSLKLNGVVHEFIAGEKTHPQMKEIHRLLVEMSRHSEY